MPGSRRSRARSCRSSTSRAPVSSPSTSNRDDAVPESLAEWLLAPYAAVFDLIEGGGPFVGWIFLCGLVLWTMVIERIWYFTRILPRQSEAMLAEWRARGDHSSWCARNIRQAMISRLNAAMTSGF